MHRIAIDARLTYYTQAGIAQYTRHLTRALAGKNPGSRIYRRPPIVAHRPRGES